MNILKLIIFIFSVASLIGCQHNAVPIAQSLKIQQSQATSTAPAQFYLCGNATHPCVSSATIKFLKSQKHKYLVKTKHHKIPAKNLKDCHCACPSHPYILGVNKCD